MCVKSEVACELNQINGSDDSFDKIEVETWSAFSGACGRFYPDTQIMAIYCPKYRGLKPANCTPVRKEDLYQTQTTRYKICRCNLEDVTNWMKNNPNITYLDISNSGYHNIDGLDLRHLITLNASHNYFEELPAIFYENSDINYKLSVIDFSHNFVLWINQFSSAFSELKQIFLSRNRIMYVFYGECENLPNLQLIDLSRNKISSLHGRPSPCVAKATLHLEQNNIADVFMSPPYSLSKIFYDWTNVTRFVYDLSYPMRIVTNSSFEGLFNTSTGIELHCRTRSFKSIKEFRTDTNSVENPMELTKCLGSTIEDLILSLSRSGKRNLNNTYFDLNEMSHLKNLQILHINNYAPMTMSNVAVFEQFEKLTIVVLVNNELINAQEIIQHLDSNIECIDLSNNYVGKINDTHLFDRFKRLNRLFLNNVSLEMSDSGAFYRLKNLQTLDIANND